MHVPFSDAFTKQLQKATVGRLTRVLPPATERLPPEEFSAHSIVWIFTDFIWYCFRRSLLSCSWSVVNMPTAVYTFMPAFHRLQHDIQLGRNGKELIQWHILTVENVKYTWSVSYCGPDRKHSQIIWHFLRNFSGRCWTHSC